ncbi:MAG: hypothetical protein LBJ89_01865 [Holosporales bacterium]|jgi:hypothetical protein|nr:hypothetical protein [Holosporales bacterium]
MGMRFVGFMIAMCVMCGAGMTAEDEIEDVVLPKLSVPSEYGELTFKEIKMPECLNKYNDSSVKRVQQRLRSVKTINSADHNAIRSLAYGLAGKDCLEEEYLAEILEESDLSSIHFIRDCIFIRLLESGSWADYGWSCTAFYSPYPEVTIAHADSMLHDGESVSRRILYVAGTYINTLGLHKKGIGPSNSYYERIVKEFLKRPLPSNNYVSWALHMAKFDIESLANVEHFFPSSFQVKGIL